jgi:hypothetical protein
VLSIEVSEREAQVIVNYVLTFVLCVDETTSYRSRVATWRGCAVAVKSLSLGVTSADSVDETSNNEALIEGEGAVMLFVIVEEK